MSVAELEQQVMMYAELDGVSPTKVAANPVSNAPSAQQDVGRVTPVDEIDPTTRQNLLPFYIDSSHKTNQLFSFRPCDIKANQYGLINIIPDDRQEYDQDLGMKVLASKYLRVVDGTPSPTKNILLNHTPAITIREYTQDTKLQLFWGLFKKFAKGFSDGASTGVNPSNADSKEYQSALEAFNNNLAKDLQNKNWWKDLVGKIGRDTFKQWFGLDTNDIDVNLALKLTYCLYYRMIGATTTNRYVIPCDTTDLMNTNGADGWGIGNEFGMENLASTKGILGKALNFFGTNLKVVTQPVWGGASRNAPTGVTINFNLYNDTCAHAINNFIFVNTICPSNMFLQYGIWQLPPSVYDIKVDGSRRWFMCSGTTSCKYKGVLREAPSSFLKELVKHENKTIFKFSESELLTRHLVRVPDIYDVTLTFQSLLPDSFNQFVYQYVSNNIISTSVTREEAFYDSSGEVGELLGDVYKKAKEQIGKLIGSSENSGKNSSDGSGATGGSK